MILIICAVVYVLQTLGGRAFTAALITSFGLTPAAVVGSIAIWQLVTYIFLHGGFFHILFNMFALWMFGSELESTWGTREFVKFFFITGVGAGISSVIVSRVPRFRRSALPDRFTAFFSPTGCCFPTATSF